MRTLEEIKENVRKNGYEIVSGGIDGLAAVNRYRRQSIIASWGGGWEHVSINGQTTPTWAEMCKLKEMFWKDTEWVVQYHPAKDHYVNNLKHCLHLWRPIEQYSGKLPLPDDILVGLKGLTLD